jgi:hypothetical protein
MGFPLEQLKQFRRAGLVKCRFEPCALRFKFHLVLLFSAPSIPVRKVLRRKTIRRM